MKTIFCVARKEFATFFSSPTACIFLGTFLAVSLFVFFWVETFFARNIAEIRPLFEWMPILMIFLSAAITMRMWAEEHRAGTLEVLLTAPLRSMVLILGKFFACMALVVLALALTLPLPITVSLLGPMDWGPVLGGYVATLFLAGAYIAIGLFVSAQSENQIVSLISSVFICALFYLLGSDTLVAFFGNSGAELLQLLGTGSRFDSITRGVIDLRDLYYYLSLTLLFLGLNVYSLEKVRWAGNPVTTYHKRWRLACGLILLNLMVANLWLAPLGSYRLDLTQGSLYSISPTTRSYLAQLREPLLIRGYFSAQTHPLLAPLVPRLRDLLKEYAVAGGDKVRVEFVDPLKNPALEQEAGQKYGIRPMPFQTASKYQTSVTNSYFDILIQYGDQFETLGFRQLIEIKAGNEQNPDVELRNPEYDITRSIKKVLFSYREGGDIFTSVTQPVTLTGYFSADPQLPKELVQLKQDFKSLGKELRAKSGSKFSVEELNPAAGGGKLAQDLQATYGFRPMSASLFDTNTFWFYMLLRSGDQVVEVPLPEDFSKEGLERGIKAGLKRFATGLTRKLALSVPQTTPAMAQYGMPPSGPQFTALREILSQEHTITEAELSSGQVPADADILVVLAPDNLNEKQVFAIDQFLMQGGTVIIATSAFGVNFQGALSMTPKTSGLEDWLQHHGLIVEKSMVLDPQSSPFPVPVERNVGGFMIQETHLVDYPYFVAIDRHGMDTKTGILSGLHQLTMNWASPLRIDEEKNAERSITPLLKSTSDAWLSSSTAIQPNFDRYGKLGFAMEGEQKKQLLAVAIEGRFSSFFAGKPSPLTPDPEAKAAAEDKNADAPESPQVILRQLDKSPDSARIIVFASNAFLSDTMISVGSSVMQSNYLEPLQLIANTVDWSLEDRGLLAIRGRSHFARTLAPMGSGLQRFWEYLNYVLVLLGLGGVWLVQRLLEQRRQAQYLALMQYPQDQEEHAALED